MSIIFLKEVTNIQKVNLGRRNSRQREQLTIFFELISELFLTKGVSSELEKLNSKLNSFSKLSLNSNSKSNSFSKMSYNSNSFFNSF
jgi:hypothetical protein